MQQLDHSRNFDGQFHVDKHYSFDEQPPRDNYGILRACTEMRKRALEYSPKYTTIRLLGNPPAKAIFNSELDTICVLHKTNAREIDLQSFYEILDSSAAAEIQKLAFHHSFFSGNSFADLEDYDDTYPRFFQLLLRFPKLRALEIVVGEQAYSGPINLINPRKGSCPGPRIQAVFLVSDGRDITWKQLEDDVQKFLARAAAGEDDTDNITFIGWNPPTVSYKLIRSSDGW